MNFFLATDIGEEISEKVSENSTEKVSELSKLFDGFSSKMISLGINIINAVIIFIIGKIIIKLLRKLSKKIIGRTSADEAVVKFVDSIIKITGYFIVFIVICSELGIETTSFITVLGSAGVAIGLALQGSLSNFAGGVLLLLTRPFKVGDYVVIEGHEGIVKKVDIIYTTIVKFDNTIINCPNGDVAKKVIINYSNENGKRVDVKFSVHYDSDINKAKKIVMDVIRNCKYVDKERENNVVVMKLADSGIDMETRAWVKPDDYWDAYFYLIENIKTELEKNNIEIPYNQLEVHINNKNDNNADNM